MIEIIKETESVALLLLLFVLSCYLLGSFFIKFISTGITVGTYSGFADVMNIGFFGWVFFGAIYFTKGNTSMIIPVIITLIFLIREKLLVLNKEKSKVHYKELFLFIIVFLFVSLGMSYLIHSDSRLLTHPDIAYYARLSHNMAIVKLEKSIIDPLIISEPTASLYHYFNEWLTVIGIKFTNDISSLKIFLLFTLPALTTFIFFNVMAVSEKLIHSKSKFNNWICSIVIMLLPGFLSLLIHLIFKFNFNTQYSSLHGGILFLKLKVVILLLLISWRFYLSGRLSASIILLLIIPLTWNSLVPAFLGGSIFLIAYRYLSERKFVSSFLIYSSVSFILLLTYLLINKVHSPSILPSYSLTDFLFSKLSNKSWLIKTMAFSLASLSPIFILFIRRVKDRWNNDFILFLYFISISALFSFALLNELFNAKQLVSNWFYPLIFIFFVFLVILSSKRFRGIFLILCVATIGLVSSQIFLSPKREFPEYNLPIAFKIYPSELVATDLSFFKREPFFLYVRPFSHLILYNQYWLPIRIDVLDNIYFSTNIEQYEYSGKSSSFYQYLSKNATDITQIDLGNYKYKFLKEFHFTYLLVDKKLFYDQSIPYIEKLNVASVFEFDEEVVLLELKWEK